MKLGRFVVCCVVCCRAWFFFVHLAGIRHGVHPSKCTPTPYPIGRKGYSSLLEFFPPIFLFLFFRFYYFLHPFVL